ncbi:MAG: hypothetical protein JNM10_17510 [Planctomycetia bacterium]|nr:hypothetical protein [Planctomycetia bacterium]
MSPSARPSRAAAFALGVAVLGAVAAPIAFTAVLPPTYNVEVVASLPGAATSVVVDGSHAYVARGAAGFDVVDRTNPSSPVVVANVLPGDGAAVYIRDVAVHAGHLYVANWDDVANGATGKFTGVYVYDVSTPSSPVEVARIDWGSQRFYHQAAMVYDLALAEVGGTPYLFCVSEITSDVEIFDVSDPSLPVWATSIVRPSTVGGIGEDVAVVGDTAYVAWLQGGVTSHDVSDLATLEAANALATTWSELEYPTLLMQHKGAMGDIRGIAVSDDQQLMAVTDDYGNGKLRLYDLSTPSVPVALGTFDAGTLASPFDVRFSGSRVFASWGSDGLRVFDVATPTTPREIARYDSANARRTALAGGQVLLADATDGTLTLGFRDQVAILSATWSKKAKRLTVKATSTAGAVVPPAVLTVVGRGTMTYSTTTEEFTFTQGVSSKPASVTVTSTWGGSATLPVTQVR